MSTDQRPDPEHCPQPFWHRTHRYCPCCTWTEQPEPSAPPSADAGGFATWHAGHSLARSGNHGMFCERNCTDTWHAAQRQHAAEVAARDAEIRRLRDLLMEATEFMVAREASEIRPEADLRVRIAVALAAAPPATPPADDGAAASAAQNNGSCFAASNEVEKEEL